MIDELKDRRTDAARLIMQHVVDRALDRGMISGELTEATVGMLTILSILRWERKVGRAALERAEVVIDALARELDAAIDDEGETTRADRPHVETLPSGQRVIVLDTHGPLRCLLDQAQQEALELGHHYVGTEHLLLAAIRTECPRLKELLWRHGVSHERVTQAVVSVLQ